MSLQYYTDGSCLGNPGVGGWAFCIYEVLDDDSLKPGFFATGSADHTTNNEMELMAMLQALKTISTSKFDLPRTVISDSQYVVNGLNLWFPKWIANGWKNSKNKPLPNKALWITLHRTMQDIKAKNFQSELKIEWVNGHFGIEGNEMVHDLANEAAQRRQAEIDAQILDARGAD